MHGRAPDNRYSAREKRDHRPVHDRSSKIELGIRVRRHRAYYQRRHQNGHHDDPCTPVQYLSLAAVAVKEGMDETEALRAITINAAEIAGIDDRVGSLAVGKDADIIIMDGHPLEFRSRVLYAIINGQVVKRI